MNSSSQVDQRRVPNFYVTGFSSEDGILILRTNLVQFLDLVQCGIFAKVHFFVLRNVAKQQYQ